MSSMDLFLIRHAKAEERRPGLPDAERQLTDAGRREFAQVVRGLAAAGYGFDVVWSSPWRRARETAELLEDLGPGGIELRESLADAPDHELLDELAAERAERVALVGHEPWMGDLATILIGAGQDGFGCLRVKKGALLHLRGEPAPGAMELRALVPPRVARVAGGG